MVHRLDRRARRGGRSELDRHVLQSPSECAHDSFSSLPKDVLSIDRKINAVRLPSEKSGFGCQSELHVNQPVSIVCSASLSKHQSSVEMLFTFSFYLSAGVYSLCCFVFCCSHFLPLGRTSNSGPASPVLASWSL